MKLNEENLRVNAEISGYRYHFNSNNKHRYDCGDPSSVGFRWALSPACWRYRRSRLPPACMGPAKTAYMSSRQIRLPRVLPIPTGKARHEYYRTILTSSVDVTQSIRAPTRRIISNLINDQVLEITFYSLLLHSMDTLKAMER